MKLGTRALRWLIAILLAIVLEGALRKWILPASLQPIAYGAKDLLAACFIVLFPVPKDHRAIQSLRLHVVLAGLILLPAFVIGVYVFPLAALMTYKNAVLWPLFALHLAANLQPGSISRVVAALAMLAAPIAALSMLQFNSPPTSPVNAYAWDQLEAKMDPAMFGESGQTRATGTFSYISGLATFGTFVFVTMLWRGSTATSRKESSIAVMGTCAGLLCSVASGSRSTIVLGGLGAAGALLSSGKSRYVVRMCGLALIGCLALLYIAPEIVTTFAARWSGAGDGFVARASGSGWDFLSEIASTPLGLGLGTQSQLASYSISVEAGQLVPSFLEDGRSRLANEAGLPGLVGLCLTVVPLLYLLSTYWFRTRSATRLAIGVIGPVLAYSMSSCLWFDHNGTAMWWTCAGILLAATTRRISFGTTSLSYGSDRHYSSVR